MIFLFVTILKLKNSLWFYSLWRTICPPSSFILFHCHNYANLSTVSQIASLYCLLSIVSLFTSINFRFRIIDIQYPARRCSIGLVLLIVGCHLIYVFVLFILCLYPISSATVASGYRTCSFVTVV